MACDSHKNVKYQVTRMYRKWDIRRKYMVLPAIADSSCYNWVSCAISYRNVWWDKRYLR